MLLPWCYVLILPCESAVTATVIVVVLSVSRARQQGLYLVMPSGGHKEDNLALVEDWSDDSDVRQVAASSLLGVVTNQNITLLDALFLARALSVIP